MAPPSRWTAAPIVRFAGWEYSRATASFSNLRTHGWRWRARKKG